ncbi:MAG: efflux RND transporter permease subunit [Planctomycetota bacterium]|jgi:multidrug efflux pump subunit AcrB
MKGAIDWFARNSVAANLLMLLIMAGGAITVFTIEQEVFPEFSLDMITVTVEYLGAAPEEVEEGVCVRIEEEIQGLEGIKEITSTAAEGLGTVNIELELGADMRKVMDDVKTRVDSIDTFPEETEKPIIQELTNRRQVINISLSGDVEETTLKYLGEMVRDEISALDGITQVEITSVRPYEISVEVSEDDLRRHGLTFDFVASAVRRSSLDMPGGSVKTQGGEILLRTKGQAYRGREFEDLVLLTRADGTHLRLGEVATIRDAFADTDLISRFDGSSTVMVEVFRTGDQAALDIAAKVKGYVAEAKQRMPEGVELTIWKDDSKVLRDRLDLLLRNGRNGFILVFICLALFLRFRLAFWVSLGIPICFLGALWLMPGLDVTISLISLFAFLVVLGIVVDDAIIVGENIFTHQQRTKKSLSGAIKGAQEVRIPVIFAVLTSVAAFVPLLNVEGTMGKIMRVIPLIVIPCLLFSLVESLLILPAHLSHKSNGDNNVKSRNPWVLFQSLFTRGLKWWIEKVYRPCLGFGLRWRYLTIALGMATLLVTLGMVGGGWIRFVFFPPIESDFISAALTMPQGTPVEVTSATVKRLEESAAKLQQEIAAESEEDIFRHMMTAVGEQPHQLSSRRGHGAGGGVVSSPHLGEVTIELAPSEERTISSTDLANQWRDLTGIIPDALELTFSASLFQPGEDINVQLTGPDINQLREAAEALKRRLGEYAGVYEIADSFREGKKEVKLKIKPQAELLGLTQADLARQVRQAFYGEEAQRIQRGRDDIRVMVRYPEEERRSLGDLENMRIRTLAGAEVPFSEVAEVEPGRGYASIKRVDRRRAVSVTASVDESQATPDDILNDLRERALPETLADYPGVLYSFEGQEAERRDSLQGLWRGFIIALVMIYALLAVPLKSYVQPLIIMSAIPFGLVGAVWGHMIVGMDLTILSMFGFVALTGVVVNDSLVMVDFINRHRREGASLFEAVSKSGVVRFRPILLTSLTTFAGLAPLIMEKSVQAKFLIPMAVSLAFGVIFSTSISLMIVPSGYMILEDLRGAFRKIFGRA